MTLVDKRILPNFQLTFMTKLIRLANEKPCMIFECHIASKVRMRSEVLSHLSVRIYISSQTVM